MEGEQFEKSFQLQDVFWVCFLNESPKIELNAITFFLIMASWKFITDWVGLFFPINVLMSLIKFHFNQD